MEIHKKIARGFVWRIFGEDVQGTDAIPVLCGPLRGRLLLKQPALDHLSMLFGYYEPAVVSEIFRLPDTTKVVYDIGAHVGYITLALAHHTNNGGKVFAFEPVPGNVELLKKLTVLNKLEERVTVFPLALGNKTGQQRFIMWDSSMMHFLETALTGQDTSCYPSVVVEGATLDSFVFDLKNPPPHLIKLDVEGAEALVLEGASRLLPAFSPSIIMEIHGLGNAHKVWEILANLDYNWVRLTGQRRLPIPTEADLMSCFRYHWQTNHFLLTREQT
jgi:FkbM family methyltransferase